MTKWSFVGGVGIGVIVLRKFLAFCDQMIHTFSLIGTEEETASQPHWSSKAVGIFVHVPIPKITLMESLSGSSNC
ncbi:hypothetical protein GQ43DRAFT_195760 [Delitschia confertaspora ATCC 74209]|uniref:Uncharacterized protein n=1 Tax=Delitschia confertaspora ATCC 74209 TaxID=1513339 RepID=A0A9P4MV55_9PLEO|nr:hypothetical protein GQ43DRAFT_195760 [Delitschia confertaspora ATCC 74209]